MAETVGVMSLWPGQEKVRGEKAGPQVLLCSLSGRARIDEEWIPMGTPGDIYTVYLFHKLKWKYDCGLGTNFCNYDDY